MTKYAMGTVNLARTAGTATAQLHKRLGICPSEYELKEIAKANISIGKKRNRLLGVFERAYWSVYDLD